MVYKMKTFTDALAYANDKGFDIKFGKLRGVGFMELREVEMFRTVSYVDIKCASFLVCKGYEHHIPWEIKCMVDKFIKGVV